MTCQHQHTTEGPAYAYTGSVARPPYTEENRAAHGNICVTETCSACGARRSVNVNGCHREYGTWGETRAEREARARRLAPEARDALASVGTLRLTRADGAECTLRVDAEGYLVIPGGHKWSELAHAVQPTEWLARASRAREVVIAAEQARGET